MKFSRLKRWFDQSRSCTGTVPSSGHQRDGFSHELLLWLGEEAHPLLISDTGQELTELGLIRKRADQVYTLLHESGFKDN